MSGEGPSKKRHVEGLQMSQSMLTVIPSNDINELLIPYMAALVQSSDRSYWLAATVWFCGLLSTSEDCPSVAKVLQSRVVPSLILFLTEENDPELQVEAAKALKYIAFGTYVSTQVTIDQSVNLVHDVLSDLLFSSDYEVLRHTCCSLAVLSGCENVKIRELLRESGIVDVLLDLVRHPTQVASALRILGNIAGGDECLIHRMIDSGVAFHLRSCLVHDHVKVRKEACWMIVNVIAGNWYMREELFRAGVIEELVSMVKNDKFCVMEAAIRAISNATVGATLEQIGFLVSRGCIEILCYLFHSKNQEIFKVCLEGLENILVAGEAEKINKTDSNPYANRIDRIGGWVVLMGVTSSYEKRLCKKGIEIMRKYLAKPLDWGTATLLDDYGSDDSDDF